MLIGLFRRNICAPTEKTDCACFQEKAPAVAKLSRHAENFMETASGRRRERRPEILPCFDIGADVSVRSQCWLPVRKNAV